MGTADGNERRKGYNDLSRVTSILDTAGIRGTLRARIPGLYDASRTGGKFGLLYRGVPHTAVASSTVHDREHEEGNAIAHKEDPVEERERFDGLYFSARTVSTTTDGEGVVASRICSGSKPQNRENTKHCQLYHDLRSHETRPNVIKNKERDHRQERKERNREGQSIKNEVETLRLRGV